MSPLLLLLFIASGCSVVYRPWARKPLRFAGLLTVKELAARAGYGTMELEVLTEDGYSLLLHRIGNNSGPPVILQHGIVVAADSWLTRGPKKDLGFKFVAPPLTEWDFTWTRHPRLKWIFKHDLGPTHRNVHAFVLLEKGFDVWLPNQRGTVYNEYSLAYKRSDPRFWDFSFHESGYYDLPAFIDTILDVRAEKQLFYIGHSGGTNVFVVMGSTRPEYNSKIRASILMSPTIFPPTPLEMAPLFRIIISNAELIYRITQLLGVYKLADRTNATVAFLREFCGQGSATRRICLAALEALSGENRGNLDEKDWNFFIPYYNGGTSVKNLYHFGQTYGSGEFKQIDHGPFMNLIKYKKPKPANYLLNLITAPVALFWGRNDPVLSETSMKMLASKLPNMILSRAVPDPKFTHLDMYLGSNANKLLYPEVVEVLNSFSNRK